METLSVAFDTMGLFLLGVATVLGVDFLRTVAGWRRDREVDALKRRLADVEALRRSESVNMAEHPDHAAIRYIHQLRADEGDSVTIPCDDPEAESRERTMCVDCCGGWTDWQQRRFYGESLLQCLARAVIAREKADTPMDRRTATRTVVGIDPASADGDETAFSVGERMPDGTIRVAAIGTVGQLARALDGMAAPDRPRHAPLPESRTPAGNRAQALGLPIRISGGQPIEPYSVRVLKPNSIVARHLGTRPICAETEGDCS